MSFEALELPPELVADPADRRAAGAFVREMLWRLGASAGPQLRALIGRAAPFQIALAAQLARLEGAEPVRELLAERSDVPLPDVSDTVLALLRGDEADPEALAELVGLSPAARDLAAMVWDRTTFVPIEQAADGIAERFFASAALRPTPDVLTEGLRFTTSTVRHQRLEAERLAGFQSHVLRTGRLAVDDPTTGAPTTYLGYVRQFDKYLYRLRGDVDFLLLAGGPSGRIRGLYLPGDDTLLTVDPKDAMQPFGLDAFAGLKLATAWALARASATPSAPSGAPRVRARVGGPENFAHVMWNSLGGLEREHILGNLERMTDVLILGSEFFGPVAELFPEIASAAIDQRSTAGSELAFVADPNAIEVPVGTSLLLPGALSRIRAAAHARATTTAGELRDRLAPYARRLYVALRVGDKSWADARSELPALIDHAMASYPDLAVILDGFALPSGIDYVTQRWSAQLQELQELVADITARVAQPDRVVSLVGHDMLTSLAVVETATVYLCPVGTAHHKIDWLFEVPGVLYTSQEYAERPFESWAGMQQRVNSYRPVPVVGRDEAVDTSRRRDASDQRRGLRNLELSWQEVWAELEALVAGSPSAPAQASRLRRALNRFGRH